MNEEPKIIVVGNIYDEKDEFLSAGRVYSGGESLHHSEQPSLLRKN